MRVVVPRAVSVEPGTATCTALRGSAEGEAVRLDARVLELDLDAAVGDLSRLAEQLVRALVANRAAAVRAHVSAVGLGCELPVEEHPEPDRRPG